MPTGYDPILSLMTEIKNTLLANKFSLSVNHSRYREEVLKALKEKDFLSFKIYKEKGQGFNKLQIEVSELPDLRRRLVSFRSFSRPGRRLYQRLSQLKIVLAKHRDGIFVSTSRGVLSIKEAVKRNLGGEILFEV